MKHLKVLIACEESQASCIAFRDLGHIAYSCDLQSCSGSKARFKTFKGIAEAFAQQWSKFILENDYNVKF